jgi:hypothetical protein
VKALLTVDPDDLPEGAKSPSPPGRSQSAVPSGLLLQESRPNARQSSASRPLGLGRSILHALVHPMSIYGMELDGRHHTRRNYTDF